MRIQWFSFVRIIGLVFVLVYHFYKDFLPGGFIGVDIFFTFSGYLITALLIDEFQKKGKIDLLGYFRRRFYRIVPPLIFMILMCVPLTLALRDDFRASIGNQILAALGFVTNFYEIRLGSHYEAQFAPHLLLHTWSLAVEVHYYILWAIALVLLGQLKWVKKSFKKVVAFLSILLGLASWALMVFGQQTGVEQSVLYYSSFSHAYPLFLGSFLATVVGIREKSAYYQKLSQILPIKTIVIGLGLSLMGLVSLALFLSFTNPITYSFGFLAASLLATLFIVCTRVLNDKLPKTSEPVWATILAAISYGIYLFHWPIYQITKELMPHEIAVLVTLIFSSLLAAISFYVIEPLLMGRKPDFLKQNPKWLNQTLMLLMVTVALLSTITTITIAQKAPKLGHFESGMLDKGLRQSATSLATTRRLVEVSGQSSSTVVAENYDNVMVIGDSVALDAFETMPGALGNAIIDTQVSRSFDMAYEIYQNHIDNGTLPDFVVLAVGANSVYDYENDVMQFVNTLPEDKHLVLVTPYSRDEYPEETKATVEFERSLVGQYDRVSIADWYQTAIDHPEIWEGSDGMHFSHTAETSLKGSDLFIQTIKDALAPFKTGGEGTVLDSTLIVGDSVAVHAGDALTAKFPTAIIDSQSNRNLADAVEIVKNYTANGSLPKNLVLAVGVNEITNFKEVLDDLLAQLPSGTRLVLVTPYNGNYVDEPTATVNQLKEYELQLAKKYSYITVADWSKVAKEHPEIWEGTDKVHFDHEVGFEDYEMLALASGYYVDNIAAALEKAQTKEGK